MYCNKCGSKLEDNDLFCGSCGAKVNRALYDETEQNVNEPIVIEEVSKTEPAETKPIETQPEELIVNKEEHIEAMAENIVSDDNVVKTLDISMDEQPVMETPSTEKVEVKDHALHDETPVITPVVTSTASNEGNVELIKSNKKSQFAKKALIWLLTLAMCIGSIAYLVLDYTNYKAGQQYGLKALTAALGKDNNWFDSDDPYEVQCDSAFIKLDRRSYDITLNGVKYDRSDVRKSEEELRKSFTDVMKSAGFYRYNSYEISHWFRYVNLGEFYLGYFKTKPVMILSYISIVLALVLTKIINKEAKKEIIVYSDSVICKINHKKSRQLTFDNIKNIVYDKNSLKIMGVGVNFKISNLTNAESIKNVIIDKKNSMQYAFQATNTNTVEELKKYKELLDAGVITQDDFDTKKKQVLKL